MEVYNFIHKRSERQYQLMVGEDIAKIEYILSKEAIYLTHTEVPDALRGKGYGKELVKRTLQDIQEKEMKVVPMCPFVTAYIIENPYWKEILKPGITVD